MDNKTKESLILTTDLTFLSLSTNDDCLSELVDSKIFNNNSRLLIALYFLKGNRS